VLELRRLLPPVELVVASFQVVDSLAAFAVGHVKLMDDRLLVCEVVFFDILLGEHGLLHQPKMFQLLGKASSSLQVCLRRFVAILIDDVADLALTIQPVEVAQCLLGIRVSVLKIDESGQ